MVEAAVWRAGGGSGPATTAWAVIAMPVLAVRVPFGVLLSVGPAAAPAGPPPPRCSRTASRATRRRLRSTDTRLRNGVTLGARKFPVRG
ncbi:DUF6629 family protein [Streptomyces sp. NPDC127106]|uniref:DUF6629 family protein n=1 Tax=Streptomyces sp. NPDC127106 TaxID=3345360 RepID=UPI00363897D0